MSPTRRLFLQNAALATIAANLPFRAFAQNHFISEKGFEPENLTLFNGVSRQTFEPWIGARFFVSLNKRPMGSIVLLSVDDLDPNAKTMPDSAEIPIRGSSVTRASTITGFSLQFKRTGTPLHQDTYLLSHDWLGTFPLFLVPSGLPGVQSTCTAVFAQPAQPS